MNLSSFAKQAPSADLLDLGSLAPPLPFPEVNQVFRLFCYNFLPSSSSWEGFLFDFHLRNFNLIRLMSGWNKNKPTLMFLPPT